MTDKQTLLPNTSNIQDTPSTLNISQSLNRSEIEPLALEVLEVLKPFCSRAEIAGSFRRGKPTVNDLDIVLEPKIVRDFGCADPWLSALKAVRHRLAAVTEKQGDKLATLYLPFASKQSNGHVQVDFYRADSATWGILLLVRTGSKEHNVKLCNLAMQKGLRLQYSVGLTDLRGRIVAGRSEEEVFSVLGLPFVAPWEREVGM